MFHLFHEVTNQSIGTNCLISLKVLSVSNHGGLVIIRERYFKAMTKIWGLFSAGLIALALRKAIGSRRLPFCRGYFQYNTSSQVPSCLVYEAKGFGGSNTIAKVRTLQLTSRLFVDCFIASRLCRVVKVTYLKSVGFVHVGSSLATDDSSLVGVIFL